jgi:hypothetical protein
MTWRPSALPVDLVGLYGGLSPIGTGSGSGCAADAIQSSRCYTYFICFTFGTYVMLSMGLLCTERYVSTYSDWLPECTRPFFDSAGRPILFYFLRSVY